MKRMSKEGIAKIVQMYRDGEKIDYIAAIVGCSMATVHRHAWAAGLTHRGKGNRQSAESRVK